MSGWFEKLNPYIGMAKGIAGGLTLLFVFAAGWHINGWRKDSVIADLKADLAESRAAVAENAFKRLSKATNAINSAAMDYAASGVAFGKQLNSINKELKDALAKNPLPADCRPDDFRMRQLQAAVDATNKRVAGQ